MSIKAIIPPGQTAIVVNGLYQWDYGQTLEIHDSTLPAIVEVHFACAGMTEAVVRSCSVVEGIAIATIPDRCLEQTAPVVAWVYCIDGTCGRTARVITLPITARHKPAPSATVPSFISDRYTELVTAINEQIEALTEGRVTAASAAWAFKADSAISADTAAAAFNVKVGTGYAFSAPKTKTTKLDKSGYYCIEVINSQGVKETRLAYWDGESNTQLGMLETPIVGSDDNYGQYIQAQKLSITDTGEIKVYRVTEGENKGDSVDRTSFFDYYVSRLWV